MWTINTYPTENMSYRKPFLGTKLFEKPFIELNAILLGKKKVKKKITRLLKL